MTQDKPVLGILLMLGFCVLALVGIGITISAGLYIIYREQAFSRQSAPAPD